MKTMKTKTKLFYGCLCLVCLTLFAIEWKLATAVSLMLLVFISAYRIVNREVRKMPKKQAGSGDMEQRPVYDGVLDTIDWN